MPNFGFRTGIFGGLTADQAATELKRIGYDCVEICLEAPDVRPETLDQTRCRQLRAALDEIGVGLASLSYHADREPFEQRRTNQECAVWATHWMGAGILVLNPEKSVDQARQWAEHIAHFKHLCVLADRLGVTIAIEPEPLLVVGSSADMARLIDEVGSPRLGVNLDIGHAQITDDDLIASIHRLGKNIVHLHLEDIKDRVHKHLPFGQGNIDFAGVRRALGDIGYTGPYVVDLFGQVDPLGQTVPPTVVAEQALHGMKERFG